MTAAAIAAGLQGRKSGAAYWARCPAHADKRPSLEITEKQGKVLVRCWSGCDQRAVIGALRDRGLWPEGKTWTPEERREYARQRAAVEQGARRLENWYTGRRERLENAAELADARGEVDAYAARQLYLMRSATVVGLAGMYRQADPGMRTEDELAGARERRLFEWLEGFVRNELGRQQRART